MPIGANAPPAWPDDKRFGPAKLGTSSKRGAEPRPPGVTAEAGETEDDSEDADLKHCPASLDACPLTGCAVPGNGKARSNEIKHGDPEHAPPNTTPVLLPLAAFADLQTAADAVVAQGEYPAPDKREALRNLSIGGQTIGEGYLVKITGYLAQMRPEGPESVNCKLKHVANNDFHLSIVPDSGDDEFHGIVVEMIPQDRPATWTTEALHKVRDKHVQVLVTGQLFYDAKHLVNPGPDPKQGQPKRFSLWEVHPVQRFFVCTQASCDPGSPDGWQEL